MAVKQCLRAVVAEKCVVYPLRGCRHGKWQISSGERFRQTENVRRDSRMFAREHPAGTAKSCQHFIRNHQYIVAIADFPHTAEKLLWPHNHSPCALKHGLDDYRRNRIVLSFQKTAET